MFPAWLGIATLATGALSLSLGLSFVLTQWLTKEADHTTFTTTNKTAPQVIKVTGENFFWQFQHPGSDDQHGTDDDLSVEQELVLLQGQPVVLELTSTDYIYTFRAPELNLLESAIPELEFTLAFTPTMTGRYLLEIDPHCGNRELHSNNAMGFVTVLPPAAYQEWLEQTDTDWVGSPQRYPGTGRH